MTRLNTSPRSPSPSVHCNLSLWLTENHNLNEEQPHSRVNGAFPATHTVQTDPSQRGRRLWSLAGPSGTAPGHLSLDTWSLGCRDQPGTQMKASRGEGEKGCAGAYNSSHDTLEDFARVLLTKCHRLSELNNRKSWRLHIETGCQQGSRPLPGSQMALLSCVLTRPFLCAWVPSVFLPRADSSPSCLGPTQ